MNHLKNTNNVEILAPGGSVDGIYAALNCGADAVYVGGQMFGARAYADNPDSGQMIELIKEVHLRGKKIYLTVNTLLKDKELNTHLIPYLEPFYENGLDAVIVQDFGVWQMIKKYFPDMPLHASTQMTVVSPEFTKFLKENGASRIVPARELSLDEIRGIKASCDIEIETFVHGALCYCYSGQCLMSSMIGGRSGNRGRCAQPCRLPYQFQASGKRMNPKGSDYLLSPKDICTLNMIPDLIDAGIDSFKIEGRMKKPEYAALVSMLYRKYTDLYLEMGRSGFKVDAQDMMHLMDLYNRGGFTEGYYKQHNAAHMISLEKPNHFGTKAAKVKKVMGEQIVLEAVNDLEGQDILELSDGRLNSKSYQWTLKDKVLKNQQFNIKNIKTLKLQPGMICYRTRNTKLIENVKKLAAVPQRKEKIYGYLNVYKDSPVTMKVIYKDIEAEVLGAVVSKAQNRALHEDDIRKQISKTGNTPYVFDHIEIDMDADAFLPVTALNQLRRDAMDALMQAVLTKAMRKLPEPDSDVGLCSEFGAKTAHTQRKAVKMPEINVLMNGINDMETVLSKPFVNIIYIEYFAALNAGKDKIRTLAAHAHDANKSVYLALPHMLRGNDMIDHAKVRELAWQMDGALVRNMEGLILLKDDGYNREIVSDARVYAWNAQAIQFLKDQGVTRLTMSEELNYKEMQSVETDDFEMIVFGYRPLMISAQCLLKTTGGCHKVNGKKMSKPYELTDRTGRKMTVEPCCGGCYNLIYNSQILDLSGEMNQIRSLGLQSIRVELTQISKGVGDILDRIYEALNGNVKTISMGDFTKGHFKRGVE